MTEDAIDIRLSSYSVTAEMLTDFAEYIGQKIRNEIYTSLAKITSGRVPVSSFMHAGVIPAALAIHPLVGGIATIAAAISYRNEKRRMKEAHEEFIRLIKGKESIINTQAEHFANTISDKSNIVDFLEKYTKKIESKRQATTSAPERLSIGNADQCSIKFRDFIIKNGCSIEEANKFTGLHKEFVAKELPEMSVLSAVQELRDQLSIRETEKKISYPGRRKGAPPIDFLKTHYEDDIKKGNLSHGQLASVDRTLFDAIAYDLKVKGSNYSIEEVFEDIKGNEKKGSTVLRRLNACAEILGVSIERAAGFFSSVRSEAVRPYLEGKSRER